MLVPTAVADTAVLSEVTGVTLPDSDSAPVPKLLNPGPLFFGFENPTLVQNPAIVDAAVSNDSYRNHSCCCRK